MYNTWINFIVFMIYLLFNLISISILDINDKKSVYLVGGIVTLIVSFAILGIYYFNTTDLSYSIPILLSIILIFGYSFTIATIYQNIEKKDEQITATLKVKVLLSSFIFPLVGMISYFINSMLGDCNDSELLCNKSIIMILILSNIVIYNSINYLKLYGNNWIWQTNDDEKNTSDIGIIFILSLWQFYIYFLVDGFRGGNIRSIHTNATNSPTDNKTITEMFSGLSIIIIITLLINTFVSNSQCEKWKNTLHINNFKEISYNMIVNTLFSIIIIFGLKERKNII